MTARTRIVGISGSLRQRSYNAALLRAAAQLMPLDSELEVASIRDIPLYDGDVEAAQGIPETVTRLKDMIAAADGLILATPEYNNGIPGVAKNAFDWLSRPPADISRVFGAKPVAVVGASPGSFGTLLAQNAWLPVLKVLRVDLWTGGRVAVAHASKAFDAQGDLADDTVRDALRGFLAGFVGHARRRAGAAR